jgi:hypothetical protein
LFPFFNHRASGLKIVKDLARMVKAAGDSKSVSMILKELKQQEQNSVPVTTDFWGEV